MNIIQMQDRLKGLSEQQLATEMQNPTGMAPQYLVLTELQRRKRVRDDFQAQQSAPTTTVAQDAVAAAGVPQQGIAAMAQSMAPQTDVTQNTGITSLGAQPSAPEEPQAMATGGLVRKMREGRAVYTDPAIIAMANRQGMTVENYLQSLGPQGAAVIAQADARAARDRMVGTEPPAAMAPPPPDTTFQSVNPSFQEPTTSVFPDDSVPEAPGLATPEMPLYGDIPAPVGIYSPKPEAPPAPPFDTTGRQEVPDISLSDAVLYGRPKTLDEAMAQPGPAAPMDLSWLGDKVSGAYDALKGMAAGASGVPPEYASADNPETVDPASDVAAREAMRVQNEQAALAAAEDPALSAPAGTGGGGGSASASLSMQSSGPQSDYEKEIAAALARTEKRAKQDMWLSVAQAGLALMSSKQPTLGGAIGEAGMSGLGQYREGRDAAEKSRMDLLGTQFDIDMQRQKMALARAEAARGAGRGGGKPMAIGMINRLAKDREGIMAALDSLPPIDEGGWFSGPTDPAAADRDRLSRQLDMIDQSLAYAYATYGMPYGMASAEEEEFEADLSD